MASVPQPRRLTPAEYLAWERSARDKHEYFNGVIVAMAGASKEHVRISVNLTRHLANKLEGSPCEPFNSDMRVKIPARGSYVYPDVTVACAPLEFEDEHGDTLLNAKVVIEVLSPSTKGRDRNRKLQAYLQLESIAEVLLVAQDQPVIERYARRDEGLVLFELITGLEASLHIQSLKCELPLAQIYQGVEFPPPTEDDEEPAAPR